MSHQVLKLRDLLSGQALKNFRRRLASVGTRPADAMLTPKFKLDLPAGCPLREDAATFDKCRELYDVVEGCGNGTLTGFLFAVILSGCRIFPDGKSAEIFSNSSVYDEDAFRIALTEAVGAPLPQFTVKALIQRLQPEVRARGGQHNRFVPEVMATD